MSENRFWFVIDKGKLEYVQDNVAKEKITVSELEDLLNELNDERMMYKTTIDKRIVELEEENEQLRKYNKQLKERLEKINGGYGHLTHRNGLTANEWLIESQERELKKKNEQISDWIEQHSKDIAKICKQQATINRLEKRLEHYAKVEAMDGDGKNERL